MLIPIILDENMNRLGMLKKYSSFLWHKCYNTCGNFELRMATSEHNYDLVQIGRYIVRDDDERVGIIEDIIITDSEDGEIATISGRFAEKILAQRIVWEQTQVSGTVENGIYAILYSNFISPTVQNRIVANFTLAGQKGYTDRLDAQYTGTNILELIEEVCQALGIGFLIKLVGGKFQFELFKGVNRSYSQSANTWVVFSDENGIVKDMTYRYVSSTETNVARVAGEGEGTARRYVTVNNSAGLNRKELFVDARDIQSDEEMSAAEYNVLLTQRGNEKMTPTTQELDSTIELTNKYIYKTDFDIGDIITIENKKWGVSVDKRIIEVMESQELGYSIIATLGGV